MSYRNFGLSQLGYLAWRGRDGHILQRVQLFRIVGEPYAFENKWKIEFMQKDCVPLPANDEGILDWKYMKGKLRKALTAARTSVHALGSL